jgi:putative transposase
MPWKECHKMDEKLRFVSRFLDGEKIAALCREFGISRTRRLASLGHPVST